MKKNVSIFTITVLLLLSVFSFTSCSQEFVTPQNVESVNNVFDSKLILDLEAANKDLVMFKK